MMLAGIWWKFTYDQIRDDSRTEAQVLKLSKRVFLVFVKKSFRVFRYSRIFPQFQLEKFVVRINAFF